MSLRKIRTICALAFFVPITLLFLDFTGSLHAWFGWMARMQFLPAVMAHCALIVVPLLLLTLLLGRVYCSVICPLGVMQDVFARLGRLGKKKRNKYSYSKPLTWLRLTFLAALVAAIVSGMGWMVALLAPYSSFGRIVTNLFAPLWKYGNNALAYLAERVDSYAFYSVDVYVKSISSMAIAAVSLIVIAVLSWRNGRTYCNVVCPVGTLLGFMSRYSLFRPVIDKEKCNGCSLCSKRCKAACIDYKNHSIDHSRCVACMDCIDTCKRGAIKFVRRSKAEADAKAHDDGRRRFLTTVGIATTAVAIKAQEKKVDGGLAAILDKKIPKRKVPVVPAGAKGVKHLAKHCTGCQLCVAVCPNGVLRPSSNLDMLMQPVMSYERGYCRPECTKCADVCPAGAICKVSREEKSSTQIGRAVWVKQNCLPVTEGVSCGNCARHCPSGAISMVPIDAQKEDSPKIPVVNEERCIGCGACENLCPSRPFSAIYVEGIQRHRTI